MDASKGNFTGRWLHEGDWQGKDFSHEFAEYDHDEHPGAQGATPMRHAYVEQGGQQVAVWVPAEWSDAQVRQALESNW
ncbi:hypothetical protein DevBK_10170 [Devosia sp. BK]|uniref:hypothetical protein n=1 Tax=unclassified Devosia TaxID=196773 RepID=UPI0007129035|nr:MULTISPECIES: hypothetical protein [unclassified Devosia]KQT49621.1 hypothetical protein ASG47_04705 [Devosia sp. Leaf420]MDV3251697.1 hypothetical protein [Devosia sp. BK]